MDYVTALYGGVAGSSLNEKEQTFERFSLFYDPPYLYYYNVIRKSYLLQSFPVDFRPKFHSIQVIERFSYCSLKQIGRKWISLILLL